MLTIIIAGMLIAIGAWVLWHLSNTSAGDVKALIHLLSGILFVIAGIFIIIYEAGVFFIIFLKFIALLLMGIGVFLIGFFPGVQKYQDSGMTLTGVFIGFILLVAGFYIIFFVW
jgi:hypothetical protein